MLEPAGDAPALLLRTGLVDGLLVAVTLQRGAQGQRLRLRCGEKQYSLTGVEISLHPPRPLLGFLLRVERFGERFIGAVASDADPVLSRTSLLYRRHLWLPFSSHWTKLDQKRPNNYKVNL